MEDERETLLEIRKNNKKSSFKGYSIDGDESKSTCLMWVFIDQSNLWRAGLSWSIFFILAIGVPLLSHFVFQCSHCDEKHRRPFDAIVQLSLSIFAMLSFISLSSFTRTYGLRRFLFLDKLCDVSQKVRQGYTQQLHRSMRLLCAFVLPCFAADSICKVWWFISGGNQVPYFYNIYLSHIIACALQMCSWLYRTSIFLFVCVLFRLICYLQILKLEDFAQVFEKESDVGSILIEHLTIRRNLKIISHRFRGFILSTLILVTASQFVSLLVTIKPSSHVNIFTSGALALCSITLVTGLLICLGSAAKITHRAQSVTSLAAKWHICATINSFDEFEDGNSTAQITSTRVYPTYDENQTAQITSTRVYPISTGSESDNEEGDGDNELDNTNMVPIYVHTISYQKRQALVTYFENNRAGISVFGFMLDRSLLHTIFAIQLSLTLWLLNKTINMIS